MKCIVKNCENHEHQGKFIGNLCAPCHRYITEGEGKYSQAYRNSNREWVGLTDEELEEMFGGGLNGKAFQEVAKLTEAKLKEINT